MSLEEPWTYEEVPTDDATAAAVNELHRAGKLRLDTDDPWPEVTVEGEHRELRHTKSFVAVAVEHDADLRVTTEMRIARSSLRSTNTEAPGLF